MFFVAFSFGAAKWESYAILRLLKLEPDWARKRLGTCHLKARWFEQINEWGMRVLFMHLTWRPIMCSSETFLIDQSFLQVRDCICKCLVSQTWMMSHWIHINANNALTTVSKKIWENKLIFFNQVCSYNLFNPKSVLLKEHFTLCLKYPPMLLVTASSVVWRKSFHWSGFLFSPFILFIYLLSGASWASLFLFI